MMDIRQSEGLNWPIRIFHKRILSPVSHFKVVATLPTRMQPLHVFIIGLIHKLLIKTKLLEGKQPFAKLIVSTTLH